MAQNRELNAYAVWAPDCTDAGALDRRLAVRPAHLENMGLLIKQGTVRIGGAVLSPDSANAADRKITGSHAIVVAESLEAARSIMENDIYYKAGVWDKEKLQILPTALATPLPPVPS